MTSASPETPILIYFMVTGSDGANERRRNVKNVTPIRTGIVWRILMMIYFNMKTSPSYTP